MNKKKKVLVIASLGAVAGLLIRDFLQACSEKGVTPKAGLENVRKKAQNKKEAIKKDLKERSKTVEEWLAFETDYDM